MLSDRAISVLRVVVGVIVVLALSWIAAQVLGDPSPGGDPYDGPTGSPDYTMPAEH